MAVTITQTNRKGRFIKGMTPWNKGVELSYDVWTGRAHSIESKKKMSESAKGRIPWNKGKKGVYKTSEETKEKLSVAHKGRKAYQWNGGKPQCLDCGKKLVSYVAKRCVSCFSASKKGENHWNWNGGVTSKDRMERVKFQKTIQKKVFERDNYTCQMCGNGGNLQVDHIQSWAEYADLRFSMDNCRTLCTKCHYLITFGKEMPETVKGWGHNLLRRVSL